MGQASQETTHLKRQTDRTGTADWRADNVVSSNGAIHTDVIAILNS
jgi:hypothetical protein